MVNLLEHYTGNDIKSVVVFAHAEPKAIHDEFFLPIREYMMDHLPRDVNILYMNGDAHKWAYEESFMGQENFLRIQLTGGTSEPPLKVIVDSSESFIESTFRYNRGL